MQAQVKLVIHSVDGSLLEKSLGEVKSLAFKEGGFSVSDLKGQALGDFAFSKVQKIEFISDITGIGETIEESSKLGLNVSRNTLIVTGWAGNQPGVVTIVGMSGQRLYHATNWDGAAIDISALPSGVYVLKVNNETFKFRK